MDALDVNNNHRVSDYDEMEIEINVIDQCEFRSHFTKKVDFLNT